MPEYKIEKLAAVIPTDWIMSEKSRAIDAVSPKPSVITGNATEPPPSEVPPATIDPKSIITANGLQSNSRAPFEWRCHVSEREREGGREMERERERERERKREKSYGYFY